MPHIPRAICANCNHEMVIEKSGVVIQAIAGHGPYYKVMADRQKCSKCDARAYVGFGRHSVAEHYEDGYAAVPSEADFTFEEYPQ